MKYAIMVDYNVDYDEEKDEVIGMPMYLGLEGEHKLFIFNTEIIDSTKLFDSAKEAGEYVDKYLSDSNSQISFTNLKIVQITE